MTSVTRTGILGGQEGRTGKNRERAERDLPADIRKTVRRVLMGYADTGRAILRTVLGEVTTNRANLVTTNALWFRLTKNRDVSTGPVLLGLSLVCSLIRLLTDVVMAINHIK